MRHFVGFGPVSVTEQGEGHFYLKQFIDGINLTLIYENKK